MIQTKTGVFAPILLSRHPVEMACNAKATRAPLRSELLNRYFLPLILPWNRYLSILAERMTIKDNFHHLIDSIDNEELLKACYQLIEKIRDEQNGHLWNSLREDQQRELLAAYEESFDEQNLLTHEAVKGQHEKWLKP